MTIIRRGFILVISDLFLDILRQWMVYSFIEGWDHVNFQILKYKQKINKNQ